MVTKKRTWNLRPLLISAIRKLFLYSPLRKQALDNAKVGTKYKCAKCKKFFSRKSIVVDHLVPVIDPEAGFPITDYEGDKVYDWTVYVYRMFCDINNLQILCKRHHKEKTNAETIKRRQAKNKRS